MHPDHKFPFRIDNDIVRTPGIDFGRPLQILHRGAKRLRGTELPRRVVVRRAGYMAWAGRFSPQEYQPTQYMIIEFLDEKTAHVVEDVEPGRKAKPAIEGLKAKCP
jgi:hypothetical protein